MSKRGYLELALIHHYQQCNEEDTEAQEYQGDENQVNQKQAISSHRKLGQDSLTRSPFQRSAHQVALVPIESDKT